MPESLLAVISPDLALGLAAAVGGGLVHGLIGFGAGLFMMPMLTLVWAPVEALTVVHVASLPGLVQLVPGAVRTARRAEVLPIALAVLVATPLGGAALFAIDADIVRIAMGIFVIAASLVLAAGWNYRGPRGALAGAAVGSLGGFINGLAGVGAPPIVLFVIAARDAAPIQRANIVIVTSVMIVMTVVGVALGGGIVEATLWRSALVAMPYIGGVWLGRRLFGRLPASMFRRGALALLLGGGISVFVF